MSEAGYCKIPMAASSQLNPAVMDPGLRDFEWGLPATSKVASKDSPAAGGRCQCEVSGGRVQLNFSVRVAGALSALHLLACCWCRSGSPPRRPGRPRRNRFSKWFSTWAA
jgi:hypothetical protein